LNASANFAMSATACGVQVAPPSISSGRFACSSSRRSVAMSSGPGCACTTL
jgi:hypothetical protein